MSAIGPKQTYRDVCYWPLSGKAAIPRTITLYENTL